MIKDSIKADISGIASASLCVIHCLFTPLSFSFNTFLALGTGVLWHLLNYVFLLLSFCAVFRCEHTAGSYILRLIQWASFVALAISVLFHDDYASLLPISYIASGILMVTHLINIILHIKS